ncbi:hypothetical protein Q1695_006547 [Nippostrongylus brasiliensis]|nr:hypothetical protein Q1695_006547 [Nippostrongylus brasiliensis]
MMCGSIHSPLVKAIQEQESVSVWRMPPSLSQSRLGGRCSPSNACTVIAVRMAEIIHRTDTWMPTALYGNKSSHKRHRSSNKTHRAAAGHEETAGPSFVNIPYVFNNSFNKHEPRTRNARNTKISSVCLALFALLSQPTIFVLEYNRVINNE